MSSVTSVPSARVAGSGGRTIAWFHCFAGIAGDMALGSLVSAGAEPGEVTAMLGRLPLSGWTLDFEPVLRGGVSAVRAVVTVQDSVVVRTHAHIVGLVEEARLPDRVARRALGAFAALAEVEGRIHRRPTDQVHFHEVGGHDAIIDIVGTAAALEVLDIGEVRASPVATGLGMVRSGHGMLPNPAPAVVGLLEGVPTWGRNVPVELTTPTGAALLAAWSSGYGPMPAMRVTGQGFGAGSHELEELPNCTQVVTGVVDQGSVPDADAGQPVVVLEANLDDATGEELAYAINALLDAGAHDAWLTPAVMKKGRPGSVVHVLSEPAKATALRAVLRDTTGSLGVRMTAGERWPVARSIEAVVVDGQSIRVKVSAGRVKAEYEDVAAAARTTGQSLRELAIRAEAEWRQRAEAEWRQGAEAERRGGAGQTVERPSDAADAADAGDGTEPDHER